MKKGVLYQAGRLDVLNYYSKVSKYLINFLKNREIATKTVLPNFTFLKRGSKDKPLFIEDMNQVNSKMLSLREKHLDEIREKLTEKQILIWRYFVPRKPVNFFYATTDNCAACIMSFPQFSVCITALDCHATHAVIHNSEFPGKDIDRVSIDIHKPQNGTTALLGQDLKDK